jgi:hypothetical protein
MEIWERDLVRGVVDEMLDEIVDGDNHCDLVRSLTFPFPVLVIARMLGLAREDLPMFHRQAVEMISAGFEFDRAIAASNALYEYFCAIIAERRLHLRRRHSVLVKPADGEHSTTQVCSFLVIHPRARNHLPFVEQSPVRAADQPGSARYADRNLMLRQSRRPGGTAARIMRTAAAARSKAGRSRRFGGPATRFPAMTSAAGERRGSSSGRPASTSRAWGPHMPRFASRA